MYLQEFSMFLAGHYVQYVVQSCTYHISFIIGNQHKILVFIYKFDLNFLTQANKSRVLSVTASLIVFAIVFNRK